MLIAEDLLLLLTHDDTGKHLVSGSTLDLALAGAVLLELAEREAVDVAGQGEQVRQGRLVVRDDRPTGDPVLDESLRRLVARGPKKPQDVLPQVGKGLRASLLARLVQRGIVRAEEGRVLGLFATRSWPAEDSAHEQQVRAALHDVLVVGRTPRARGVALISLLQAVDAVPKVVGGLPGRELKRRAKAVAEGEFAGQAVRKAVEAVNSAVYAGIAAAAATTAASGSS